MKWMPIETAPKDGTHILLYGPREWDEMGRIDIGPIVGSWYQDPLGIEKYDGWFTVTSNPYSDRVQPTHWMPLPPPPETIT